MNSSRPSAGIAIAGTVAAIGFGIAYLFEKLDAAAATPKKHISSDGASSSVPSPVRVSTSAPTPRPAGGAGATAAVLVADDVMASVPQPQCVSRSAYRDAWMSLTEDDGYMYNDLRAKYFELAGQCPADEELR